MRQMRNSKELLERARRQFPAPERVMDSLRNRRDRKRRNQRITAGVVGIAVFVAAGWIVRDATSLGRTERTVVPGGSGATGPAETGPSETTTGPPPTKHWPPVVAEGPVPETDYLLDLDTGEMTPLPKSIVGTQDRIHDYAASPDGSKLAYAGPGENGASQVFIANLDGGGVEQVTTDDEAMAPTWSPDGSKIAYVGQRGDEPANIFLLDLATGISTRVTFETESYDTPPSFTPDGASIVYGAKGEVRIVPIAGGEGARLADGGGLGGEDVHLSPDGSLLAYTCTGPLISICVANADGTDARHVAGGPDSDSLVNPRWSPDGTRLTYWAFHASRVFVVDVATGRAVQVTDGAYSVWLDDHTLIVKADRCVGPITERCGG